MQISIVLQHTRIADFWKALPVKRGEIIVFKSSADLLCTISPEIEEDHTVVVLDFTHRTVFVRDDKGRQILIYYTAFFAVCADCLFRSGKGTAFSQHMGIPAPLYHTPICFISVHCNIHTAAAAGDSHIKIPIAQFT